MTAQRVTPPGGKPFDLDATVLLPVHLMAGTGYGLEQDWRHGMYQGPDLVVQGVSLDLSQPQDAARMWGMVDAVARFEYEGHTGYGLYEYWALGDHPSFRWRIRRGGAVAHGQQSVGGRGDAGVVGHQDDGLSVPVEFVEQAKDVRGGRAVEVARRFVREQHSGSLISARATATRCL